MSALDKLISSAVKLHSERKVKSSNKLTFDLRTGNVILEKTDYGVLFSVDESLLSVDSALKSVSLTAMVASVLEFFNKINTPFSDKLDEIVDDYQPNYVIPESDEVKKPFKSLFGSYEFKKFYSFLYDMERDNDFTSFYKLLQVINKDVYDAVFKGIDTGVNCIDQVRENSFSGILYLYTLATRGVTYTEVSLVFVRSAMMLTGFGSDWVVKEVEKGFNREELPSMSVEEFKASLDSESNVAIFEKYYAYTDPDDVGDSNHVTPYMLSKFAVLNNITSAIEVENPSEDKDYVQLKRMIRRSREGARGANFAIDEVTDLLTGSKIFGVRVSAMSTGDYYRAIFKLGQFIEENKLTKVTPELFGVVLYSVVFNYVLLRHAGIEQETVTELRLDYVSEGGNAGERLVRESLLIKSQENVERLKVELDDQCKLNDSLKEKADAYEGLLAEIKRLSSKVKVLQEDLEEVQNDKKELRKTLEDIMDESDEDLESSEVTLEEMLKYLSDKNIGVFGGRRNWANALVKMLPNIEWYPYTSVNDPSYTRLRNKDYIFFNGLCMSHSMSYKFASEIENYYPLRNITGGAVVTVAEIYESVKRREAEV